MEQENKKYMLWSVDIDNRHKIPDIRVNGNQQYFPYGHDNAYTDYLIQLVNRSSVHATIVKQKAKFIFGNGMKIAQAPDTELEAKLQKFMTGINRLGQSIDNLNEKIIMDLEIFNGFALKVVWSVLTGEPTIKSVYHVPWDSLRVGRDENGVWHSNVWTPQQAKTRYNQSYFYNLPPDAKFYPFFNPNTVSVKQYEQIYYFRVYNAQMKVYPMPEYISCNTDIEASIEISNFDLNNVKTGFAAGAMVNMFNGMPSDDEAKQMEKDIKAKMAGTDNAGQILLNFTYPDSKGAEIVQFRPNDMAEQYLNLDSAVRDRIFVGHQVNNPMLFGIRVPGELGGKTELVQAYEQFQNIYINARQQAIENVWNDIASYHLNSDAAKMKFTHSMPIGIDWSEQALLQALPIEAIRDMIAERMGIDLSKYTGNFNQAFSKSVDKAQENPTDDEQVLALFAACGEEDTYEGDVFECDLRSSQEAALIEKAYNFARIPVVSVTDPLERLYQILTEEPKISLDDLAKRLSTSRKEAIKMLNDLQRLNILDYKTDVVGDRIEVKRLGPVAKMPQLEEGYQISVKYKYFGPQDSKNRPFCREMLNMNRLYTREEIDNISDTVGYNVWLRRGGWYKDPTTDIPRPSCRHTWMQKVIKTKL